MSFKLKQGAIIHFSDTSQLPAGPYKQFVENIEATLKNNPHKAEYIGFQVKRVYYDDAGKIQYEITAIEKPRVIKVTIGG